MPARKAGKNYDFSENLRAMVYSLLSAQRPWAEAARHLEEIDGIFFEYDAERILEQPVTYFVERIRAIEYRRDRKREDTYDHECL